MHGLWKHALGLMAVVSLLGCGGPPPEAEAPAPGEIEQGLACAEPDNWCPGTTTCVNGLCRDCVNQPQFCYP
ncbi:hypothetical protein [Myxococcus sp. Y35]|uniref:hypothetical protein n=1 Tax=Pseudomyxococcus flavus TaxID=3115648 RepID=UPI003CEA786E